MSTLFLRTLRADPAEAEVPSHRLLVRAGYIRRTAAGVYSWLPLGKRVLDNVTAVVKAEMDGIGAQEVLLPALQPREPWDRTGRYEAYGPLMFKLADRKGAQYCLGPTAEEMVTMLVKGEYSSYRDLPVSLYQVQTKYRDELRPRSGLIRGREFVMKDAYSFHADTDSLKSTYAEFRGAYERIFTRVGLDFRVVEAVAGEIGGDINNEFMAPAEVGEDLFVYCLNCDYASNVEAVESGVAPAAGDLRADAGEMTTLHTPGVPGIAAVVEHLGDISAADMLKTMLFTVDGAPTAVLVPGDREVDEGRLARALAPAVVERFDDDDFAARPDLVRGYAGPQGMRERGVRVLADVRVVEGSAWVTGANEADHHVRDAVAGRDFTVDAAVDVATVATGDPCPRCGRPLQIGRSIEVGHIFQLGQKYSDPLGLSVAGPDGAAVPVVMGCYGIGVSRVVASVVEQTADGSGLCWPAEIAPYDVHVVPVGKGEEQLAAAETLSADLERAGCRVLLDDRRLAAGVAFTDADLLGMPTIVIVGKALADGEVEVKDRRSGERRRVGLDRVVAELAPGRQSG
ncbi:MAG: proline--tRNA ligase [Actinomycetota bacterium]|nr:proline--tRNA ligase [Actinomycetota bacterium]